MVVVPAKAIPAILYLNFFYLIKNKLSIRCTRFAVLKIITSHSLFFVRGSTSSTYKNTPRIDIDKYIFLAEGVLSLCTGVVR